MRLRNSSRFFAFTAASCLILLFFAVHSAINGNTDISTANHALVKELHLTDLCLFTEARYTRNPALVDHHAPFQEHPTAFEHFPSGSLLQPIKTITGANNVRH